MTTVATVDQIQYLFTFPFKDEEWKRKILIAFLLAIAGFIIPFIPWIFLAGYIGQILGRAITAEKDPGLPEWDDWGGVFIVGLRLVALWFIVALPVLAIFGLGYVFMFLPAIFAPLVSDSDAPAFVLLTLVGTFGGMVSIGLSIFLGLLLALIFPPVAGHVIHHQALGAAFRVREWWSIFRANFGGYLLSYILVMGTAMIGAYTFQLLYLTVVLCCLLPFLASLYMVYIGVVSAALYGQAYRIGLDKGQVEKGAGE